MFTRGSIENGRTVAQVAQEPLEATADATFSLCDLFFRVCDL